MQSSSRPPVGAACWLTEWGTSPTLEHDLECFHGSVVPPFAGQPAF